MARPRKNPQSGATGEAGAEAGSPQTTASSNTHRRSQKRTLSTRLGAMERKIDALGDNIQRIARGVS